MTVTLFPLPLSPTMASVSPCVEVEADAVHRVGDPIHRVEFGHEVLDFQDARHRSISPHLLARRRRGSSTLRSQSPTRFKASDVITIAMPGRVASQG